METECQYNGTTAPGAPAAQLGQPRPGAYVVTVEPPPAPINEWKNAARRFGIKKRNASSAGGTMINAVSQEATAEVATGA